MTKRDLIFTSRYCQENCLDNDPHVEIQRPPEPDKDAELFNVNGFETDDNEPFGEDEYAELDGVDGMTFADPRSHVPKELHKYLDVFDNRRAKKMPFDWNKWNFRIEFIKGWEGKLPKPAKRY